MGLHREAERGSIYPDREISLLESKGKKDLGKIFLKMSFDFEGFFKNMGFSTGSLSCWNISDYENYRNPNHIFNSECFSRVCVFGTLLILGKESYGTKSG